MERRAVALAAESRPDFEVDIAYRPSCAAESSALVRRMLDGRADAIYVFDTNPRELAPAALARVQGIPLVLEIGDMAADLLRNTGASASRVAWRTLFERAGWHRADTLVVRGEGFRDVLLERGLKRTLQVLPEGVDLELFRPEAPSARAELGIASGSIAVGVVGSIVWNESASTAYGWELVEALPSVPANVRAVVVGAGDGIERLRSRAAELGASERLITPGPVPHERIPGVLAALDAVTWTQTPDSVGRCRTTLKLPEYLACGKYVIASDVGEAGRCIRDNGVRVPYAGGRDPHYVAGVAAAISAIAADPSLAGRGLSGIPLARRFAWDRIGAGFAEIVRQTLERPRKRGHW
jgi:glycosyltransferase involved in cell wall biosynthesis